MTAVPGTADLHDRPSDFMAFAPRSSSGIRGRLYTVDLSLMDHRMAAEILAEVPRLIAYATALQATAVERVREGISNEPLPVRDGQPTRLDGNLAHGLAVTEIATIQETSESAAARLLNVSEALCVTHLGVLEALESGDIQEHHARTIVDQSGTLSELFAEPSGLQALEKARTASGRLRTPAEFRRAVRDFREKPHPESITVRKRAPAEHRTLPQLRHDVLAHLGLTGTIGTTRADNTSQTGHRASPGSTTTRGRATGRGSAKTLSRAPTTTSADASTTHKPTASWRSSPLACAGSRIRSTFQRISCHPSRPRSSCTWRRRVFRPLMHSMERGVPLWFSSSR